MVKENTKVLIADELSAKAIEILKSNNLVADVKTGLKGEELQAIIGDYDAVSYTHLTLPTNREV